MGGLSTFTLAVSAVLLAVLIVLFLRRARRVRRVLIIEVGEPELSLAGRRQMSIMLMMLILALVAASALLAARLFVPFSVLAGFPLIVLALLMLGFYLLMTSRRPPRSYVVLVNVARSRSCDLFYAFTPPGDAVQQQELAKWVGRLIASENFCCVLLNLPRVSLWWSALGPLINELSILAERKLPCFAICAWREGERLINEGAFIRHLLTARIPVILSAPRCAPYIVRLVHILPQYSQELYQIVRGVSSAYIIIPCDENVELHLRTNYPCYEGVQQEHTTRTNVTGGQKSPLQNIRLSELPRVQRVEGVSDGDRHPHLILLAYSEEALYRLEPIRVVRHHG